MNDGRHAAARRPSAGSRARLALLLCTIFLPAAGGGAAAQDAAAPAAAKAEIKERLGALPGALRTPRAPEENHAE